MSRLGLGSCALLAGVLLAGCSPHEGTSTAAASTSSSGGETGSSGSTGGGSSSTGSTGGSSTGGIDRNTKLDGLTVDTLRFAVFGDTRPNSYVNDPAAVPSKYPTAVVTRIFQQINDQDVAFATFTGDVVATYNPTDTLSAQAQIDLFLQARAALDKPLAACIGNHDKVDGTPAVWSQKFGQLFYYGFTVHTGQGDARFTVLDDTYMSSDARQMAWIESELSSAARYHIVIKHHPTDASDYDDSAFLAIVARHPATLILSGHEHAYRHTHARELVLGTGGAPLSNAGQAFGYGYALVEQQPSGSLKVSVIKSASNLATDTWTVAP